MRSPYQLRGKTVLSFSGGRTSAYMLHQVIQNNDDLSDLLVLFANTGKEHPATLEFVQECEYRWGVPITWLEYRDDDKGFAVVDFDSCSRSGEPFEALIQKRKYLPNPVTRFCTIDLKIKIIHKYLRSLGLSTEDSPVEMLTGIRADEPRRVAKIRARGTTSQSVHASMGLPLVDAGVGVGDVGSFWSRQPFNLNLLAVNGRTLEGNCDLCFLKPRDQVYSIIASDRTKGEWWARQERSVEASGKSAGAGDRFRQDRPSYQRMIEYADQQFDMFATDELIECFCGD